MDLRPIAVTKPSGTNKHPPQPFSGRVFHKVAQNLSRLESSGTYYARFKRGGKQIPSSLKPLASVTPSAMTNPNRITPSGLLEPDAAERDLLAPAKTRDRIGQIILRLSLAVSRQTIPAGSENPVRADQFHQSHPLQVTMTPRLDPAQGKDYSRLGQVPV